MSVLNSPTPIHIGRTFYCQRVNRNAFRIKFYHAVKSIPEALSRFRRQTCYEIRVYVVESDLARSLVSLNEIRSRVPPAYHAQHFIIERLRIHGNPVSAKSLYNAQFFLGNGIGTTCLKAVLAHIVKVEVSRNSLHNKLYIACRKRCGSSAAEVYRIYFCVVFLYDLSDYFKFPAKRRNIVGHKLYRGIHTMRNKGTVTAPCRAERNRNIETDRARVYLI